MRPLLDRIALAATLLLPVCLMHSRGGAEAMVALVDAAFLARCIIGRDWSWLRAAWVRIALAWWLWQAACSLPGVGVSGWHGFIQALVIVRVPLFAAALGSWVLVPAKARRWLQIVIVAAALYIAGQSWLQYLTGRNLWGFPRYPDGALSGPFYLPRAGAPLARLLFPAFLPWVARLLDGGAGARLGAAGVAVLMVGTEVMIGQRIPTLLTLLGLAVVALLLPALRRITLIAVAAAALLLAVTPWISPPTYYRLVTKFSAQMADFPDSDYGLIFARAVIIGLDHPVIGRGFDGYRYSCADPDYFRGWSLARAHPDGGAAENCNIHPHNHYLEAFTNAGVPGLLLFAAMVAAWLVALARGLGRRPDPLRVGLFAAVLMNEWPISSMSGFPAIESTGYLILLLGYGLAAASTAPISPAGSTPST